MRKWTPRATCIAAALIPVLIGAGLARIADGQQALMQNQESPSSRANESVVLQKAISNVEKGAFTPVDIAIIVRWHALQAISPLETQFDQSKNPTTKARLANALLSLGDKKGRYLQFVIDHARQVLEDVPPTPFEYSANGKAIGTVPSNQLQKWAKRHHVTVQQASHEAMFDAPEAIMELGINDDAQAIPVLREALHSKNDLVTIAAAQSLAELHDTASVPEIIKACENAPKEKASSIAQSLIYFDDPAAQRAVDMYVPKSTAQELRNARAHGKTPYH